VCLHQSSIFYEYACVAADSEAPAVQQSLLCRIVHALNCSSVWIWAEDENPRRGSLAELRERRLSQTRLSGAEDDDQGRHFCVERFMPCALA